MKHVLNIYPFPRVTQTRLEENFEVHKLWDADDKDAFIAGIADKIEGIATMGNVGVGADIMSKLPNLKITACFGVGYDAIDIDYAAENGIFVTNTPDVLNDCVADMTLGLLLSISREIVAADKFVRAGEWPAAVMYPLTTAVGGKTIGILGMGRIGEEVADRARAFKMNVAYHNRSEKPDNPATYYPDVVSLAAASDYLVCNCPGGPETENLINAEVLKALGPNGYLINIARGSVVDEPALIKALQNNEIAGAGLDVFVDEPTVPEELMQLDNVVLHPHHGSGTKETRKAMGDMMIDNLIACLSGQEPPNRVV